MLLLALYANIPRYFIQHYMGEESLGAYSAMAYAMVAVTGVAEALGHSATPRLSRYFAGGQIARFDLAGETPRLDSLGRPRRDRKPRSQPHPTSCTGHSTPSTPRLRAAHVRRGSHLRRLDAERGVTARQRIRYPCSLLCCHDGSKLLPAGPDGGHARRRHFAGSLGAAMSVAAALARCWYLRGRARSPGAGSPASIAGGGG
jgi:hypothetical protein